MKTMEEDMVERLTPKHMIVNGHSNDDRMFADTATGSP
jgi:hypothetical protein